jgi:hypothetical protein
VRRLAVASALLCACGADDGTSVDAGMDVSGVPAGCVPDRASDNRLDDNRYDQIRVLYVLPADTIDQNRDTSGQICNSVRAFATWFSAQADRYLRFDTSNGLIDIGFVRLGRTDAEMRGNDPNNGSVDLGTAYVRERIERELIAMGMIDRNKLYAVYYEGSSTYACGAGAYPPVITARVGTMYLGGLPIGQTVPCGQSYPWGQASLVPNYIDYGMLHELVHSMGIVPTSSPNQHQLGHVFDFNGVAPNRDLMYSPRVGANDPGWATNDAAGLVLDLGKDDYFTAANAAIDLATMSLISPLPERATRPIGW